MIIKESFQFSLDKQWFEVQSIEMELSELLLTDDMNTLEYFGKLLSIKLIKAPISKGGEG